jgi:hypothetical protein
MSRIGRRANPININSKANIDFKTVMFSSILLASGGQTHFQSESQSSYRAFAL